MNEIISNITQQLRNELAPVLGGASLVPQARELLGERTQLLQGTVTSLQDFSKEATKGIQAIKQMQLAIDNDALDKILKMNLSGLPALEALVKANLMQHHCGINHTQMLMIFERACISFEQGDVDLAMGIFIALLFLNPFIAPLWYCVARAYETKKNLPQGLFSYAICDLLSRGNLYSALDATECLIASGNKKLADILLREIEIDLANSKFPPELRERSMKLRRAIEFIQ